MERCFLLRILLRRSYPRHIAHLKARKETRWRGFGQNMGYPGTKDDWDKKAVNSVYENGKIKILFRDLTQTPDFGQKGGTL